MQKTNSSSDGFTITTTDNWTSSINTSPEYLSRNPFFSPTSQNQLHSTDFTSSYLSFFPPNSNSLSISPSGSSFGENVTKTISTENRLHQASFILEYQQLYNRYTLCLAHLQQSIKEVDAIREENDNLRLANTDLVQRLNLQLSQATIQNCVLSSAHRPSMSFISDFNRLTTGNTVHDSHVREKVPNIRPKSLIEHNRFEKRNEERVTMPKSISVRSSGYKLNQRCGSNGGPSENRVTSQSLSGSQRVYVPAGKTEEEALELEVYNQGMLKTELCNKWQETGKCMYGDRCQFAHGITELRPVIRHQSYKTEVCRMVLTGDMCPYGHRCHFRHSLSDQEKLLALR